jgi:hypothetical protein
MDVKLKTINRSNDADNSDIIVFEKDKTDPESSDDASNRKHVTVPTSKENVDDDANR